MISHLGRPTACGLRGCRGTRRARREAAVPEGGWKAGLDNAVLTEPTSRKELENAPTPSCLLHALLGNLTPTSTRSEGKYRCPHTKFLHRTQASAMDKRCNLPEACLDQTRRLSPSAKNRQSYVYSNSNDNCGNERKDEDSDKGEQE